MTDSLVISHGQYSDRGRKPTNQDFHGVYVPQAPLLGSKGIAVALADGISSSSVSQEASKTAVSSFFSDYYSTAEAWSVKKSGQCVLTAINSWLHAQTRRSPYRYNLDKGYVCTFSGMVLKSASAHLFHVGDARIYQVHGTALEQLTNEHRVNISSKQHYLQRALGMADVLEFDYREVKLAPGSLFLLVTDGIYEAVSDRAMADICRQYGDNLDEAAQQIVQAAYNQGSDDNLTCQIIRVESLPASSGRELYHDLLELPIPPVLDARQEFEGHTIVRHLHRSARSHVYLAVDNNSGKQVVIKTPSRELQGDTKHLERFLLEEWIARRIHSPHVLKPGAVSRHKNHCYITLEYLEGQTLGQWMVDNPTPCLQQVREIIEQVARGLQAFHRLEMLHQDLRPENIMIDHTGTVKIIDFGSTWVAGLEGVASSVTRNAIVGTFQYSAPEYFIGEYGTVRSDQFALAVITYQMLTGHLPYGARVSRARTRSAQRQLRYRSVLNDGLAIPAWVDATLGRALSIDPNKRYPVISEFIYDLSHPNPAFANQSRRPLMQRNPLVFWQSLSAVLTIVVLVLSYFLAGR